MYYSLMFEIYVLTDRQIDRQTDRQTDRQIDRQIDRQTDRQRNCTALYIGLVSVGFSLLVVMYDWDSRLA